MDQAAINVAVMLATPAGVAVVGALLWWRTGRVESEVLRLRDDRHKLGNDVARMQGTVETLGELVRTVLTNNRGA